MSRIPMDDPEPAPRGVPDRVLTPEQREALQPQRPPGRFAERVMADVAALRQEPVGRRRATALGAVAGGVTLAVAAAVALVVAGNARGRAERGEIRAEAWMDVHLGPHIVAALSPGAHVRWDGDEVTQTSGRAFYRVEADGAGGTRLVHTPAGDVTVRGTCFEVKVRAASEEAEAMTQATARELRAGAVGAIAAAAVLVGVYEGKVRLSRASGAIDVTSGQGARADASGVHGPQELAEAEIDFESSAGDDPWRAANASLADQVKAYQRRLEDNEAQRKSIEKELKELKAKLGPDGGAARDAFELDPRDFTTDDWKQLAKAGAVRAGFLCPPADWHPSAGELGGLGLAPGDAPALEAAVHDAQQRTWQAIEPACARIVGSDEVARRLGGMACGVVIQNATGKADFNRDVQRVADIRAGNTPMPPASQLDPLEAYWLALTGETSGYEAELAKTFGPETAHRVARFDGISCGLNWGRYASV